METGHRHPGLYVTEDFLRDLVPDVAPPRPAYGLLTTVPAHRAFYARPAAVFPTPSTQGYSSYDKYRRFDHISADDSLQAYMSLAPPLTTWHQPEPTSEPPKANAPPSNFHSYSTTYEQSSGPPRWTSQAKDPTSYHGWTSMWHEQPATPPEWIAQAKDPTPCSKRTSTMQAASLTANHTIPRRANLPARVPRYARSSDLPGWIDQAKEPTAYSKAKPARPIMNPAMLRHTSLQDHGSLYARFLNLPEWIDQAKDPAAHPKETPVAQLTNHTMGPTMGNGKRREEHPDLHEGIAQAKDPTIYYNRAAMNPPTSLNGEQYISRKSPDEVKGIRIGLSGSLAAGIRSFMSRISKLCRPRSQKKETQRNNGSPVTGCISPTPSATLRPSLSANTGPPLHGHGSLHFSSISSDGDLRTTPMRSPVPPEWIPQDKDPTASSDETDVADPSDSTVKQEAPFFPETTCMCNELLEVTPTGSYSHPSVIHNEVIRDLTELVRWGPMVYKGHYSDVYRGACGQQLIAIKVTKSLPSDPLHAVRRRMRREIGTASRFNHPNVLAVYGVIEAGWCEFGGIVTLWCPNGDAYSYLRSNPLAPSARLVMACGVAAGLEYIHSLSVVHGDLKPGNILIDASGNPLICDFGLVCILDAHEPERIADNTTTVHSGTVRYLASELAKDPPDPRTMASDVHALGCVAYEFLYLERPYSARSGNNAELYIFGDIRSGIPPAPRPPPPLLPCISAIWNLLEWCWDRDPNQRPKISTFQSRLMPLARGDLPISTSDDPPLASTRGQACLHRH